MKQLRLLLISDSAGAAGQILTNLKQTGFIVTADLVGNAANLQTALNDQPWDISVFLEPIENFSPFDALKLIQASQKELPFFYIALIAHEELAVHLLQLGAAECLESGQLARLPLIIRRELELIQLHAEHKNNLQASEEHFRQIVEQANEIFYRQNIQTGEFIYLSPKTHEFLGLDPDQFLEMELAEQAKFIHPDDLPDVSRFGKDLIESDERGVKSIQREFRLRNAQGDYRWIHGNYTLIRDTSGNPHLVVGSLHDITALKQAERLQTLSSEILTILNQSFNPSDISSQILSAIQRETGIEAIGIRLRKDGDYPYAAQQGFPDNFIRAENSLTFETPEGGFCLDENGKPSLGCTCGLVIMGKTNPASPVATSGGSIWTNDSLPFLEVPPSEDARINPRNRCIHSGYLSVALIPIRVGTEIIGLLQLNDRRKDRFTPELIYFFEGIAASFGVALVRQQTRSLLEEESVKYRGLFENMIQGAFRQSSNGQILDANPAALRMFGTTREEFLGRTSESPSWDVIHEDGAPFPSQDHPSVQALTTGKAVFGVIAGVRNETSGERVWMEINAIPEFHTAEVKPYQVMVTMHDITAHNRIEAQLKQALAEKETLLRELYHRTKNNMQVIISLLSLQAAQTNDPTVDTVFRETQNRIRAMALVHQMLYQTGDLSRVDLSRYLWDLSNLLVNSYNLAPGKISLELDLAPEYVLIDTAIPCGLILNELVSNTLKYAFPQNRTGVIRVTLKRFGPQMLELIFNDNGVGVPPGFDYRQQESLGFKTIITLVEHQLQGKADFRSDHGVTWRIQFTDTLYEARV
jgi:PAS domain S-box-containing protein